MRIILKSVIFVFIITIIQACNQTYDFNKAIKRGDIVDLHGQVSNLDRMDEFINNIDNGTKDEIRLTRFTIEGDPIFYDFYFDGSTVKYKYDNSKDKYGTSNINTSNCKTMNKLGEGSEIEYKLEGCHGKNAEFGNRFSFKVIP